MGFNEFREMMKILLNIDSLDRELFNEYVHDWYTQFRENKTHDHPLPWALEHFQDISPATHDFWLDARGVELIKLREIVRKFL